MSLSGDKAVTQLVAGITPVEAIVRLAQKLPVFPCRRSAEEVVVDGRVRLRKPKSPLTERGFHDATQDADQIRAWWRRWPDALVGVPTGSKTGLVVIDYDTHKADDIAQAWISEHAELLMATRTHGTLSGGRHYLFKVPPGQLFTSGVDITLGERKCRGIDIRAEGGYIVWWPAHGAVTTGEVSALPVGLIDQRKVDTRPLPALPRATPEKWARDKVAVTDALAFVDPAAHDGWLKVGMAIHLASGGSEDGFHLWHAWSAGELNGDCPASYSGESDCRYRWASFNRDGRAREGMVTLGSVFHMATDAGWSRTVTADLANAVNAPAPPRAESADHGLALSDDELTRRFTERHGDAFRHVATLGRWYRWTGKHWRVDDSMLVYDAARASCRLDLGYALAGEPTDAQARALRGRLGSAATIAAVVRLASADRRHAATTDALDANPWLLNTPGGTLDLRTGLMRPHDPADLITKLCAAIPAPECPTFLRTLERAVPDAEMRQYLQRLVGYLMTGIVRDHIVVLVYGPGGNGKSAIFNAIRHALGDYAITLGAEVLMESHNDRHPTEIAVLRGARMALCSEVDSGRRWNEARVKRLSGGDPITARLIARDPFEFLPTHKLVLLANAKPGLRVVDEAIRRRIHLVELGVTIPEAERDPELPEKLKAEAGGIITWALAGCADWQSGGLRPPQAILDATDRYLDREDAVAEWMRDCCRPLGTISLSAAHASFRSWAESNGIPPVGRNTFGDQLEAHGIERVEVRRRVWMFNGLSIMQPGERRHVG